MTDNQPWHPEAFVQNDWTRKYRTLVEHAQAEKRTKIGGEHSEHHIVPESFFIQRSRPGPPGWLSGNPEDPSNLVLLTHREHAQCHLWLWEHMTEGLAKDKMALAIKWLLVGMEQAGKPYKVSVTLLTKIMRDIARVRLDQTIRNWAHLDGRTFVGTRSSAESYFELPHKALISLTRKKSCRIMFGVWIVRPEDDPSKPPKLRGRPGGVPQPKLLDGTVYYWASRDGRIFTGTRSAAERFYGLNAGALSNLTKPSSTRRISHGLWIVGPYGPLSEPPRYRRSRKKRAEAQLDE